MGFVSTQWNELIKVMEAKVHVPWIISSGCCTFEIENVTSSTYHWQRLGILECATQPAEADLLIVAGFINEMVAEEIKKVFASMREKKVVIALGACAVSGSPYSPSKQKMIKASDIIPVDVFVPGCPPRPEAILEALKVLENKLLPGPDQRTILYGALRDSTRTY